MKPLQERAWVYVVSSLRGQVLHVTRHRYRAELWIRGSCTEATARIEKVRGCDLPREWHENKEATP